MEETTQKDSNKETKEIEDYQTSKPYRQVTPVLMVTNVSPYNIC